MLVFNPNHSNVLVELLPQHPDMDLAALNREKVKRLFRPIIVSVPRQCGFDLVKASGLTYAEVAASPHVLRLLKEGKLLKHERVIDPLDIHDVDPETDVITEEEVIQEAINAEQANVDPETDVITEEEVIQEAINAEPRGKGKKNKGKK